MKRVKADIAANVSSGPDTVRLSIAGFTIDLTGEGARALGSDLLRHAAYALGLATEDVPLSVTLNREDGVVSEGLGRPDLN